FAEINFQEEVERDRQEERDDDFRDHDSREQVNSQPRTHRQPRIETRPGAAHPASEIIDRRDQQHGADRQRQPRREFGEAENLVCRRHRPIHQRRLLQIANAVNVQRHPIAALDHLARGLSVRGVGVVLQRRLPRAAYINQRGQQQQKRQMYSRGELIERGAGNGGGVMLRQLRQFMFKQGFAPYRIKSYKSYLENQVKVQAEAPLILAEEQTELRIGDVRVDGRRVEIVSQ